MMNNRFGIQLLAAWLSIVAAAARADNRLILLGQDSWDGHRGFYLDLENPGPGRAGGAGSPLTLSSMSLALGVADGASWHFVSAAPHWTLHQPYHVRAVLEPGRLLLLVDGRQVGQVAGVAIAPAADDATADDVPGWANAATDYRIIEKSIRISSGGRELLQHAWSDADAAADLAQAMFSPVAAWHDSRWRPESGQPLQIDAVFILEPQNGDLHALAPFVDRYGQDRFGQWSGKITADLQLVGDAAAERRRLADMPPRTDVDAFGGEKAAGWRERATGFYRVVRHGRFWWLITPTGLPCFYTGVCTAPMLTENGTPVQQREYLFADLPPRTGPFAAAWSAGVWGEVGNQYVAFDTANMIRRYGADQWRKRSQELCAQRLAAWGFTGLGKWDGALANLPFVAVLSHWQDPKSGHGKLDVFDPAARERFRADLAGQMQPYRRDPHVLGWSVGNEIDEIVRNEDLAAMLQASGPTPAKRAIVARAIAALYGGDAVRFAAAWHATGTTANELSSHPLTAPPADIEPLRQFYATAYYRFIYQTIKSIDPDHLYLGFWIVPGWWQNDSDWSLISPYCDVIGYDRYSETFCDALLGRLMQRTDKPILCGEFSFPPTYNGQRGFGVYPAVSTADDAAAGQHYQQWMHDATRNPYCVGGLWFEYRDEPITGRGPGMGPALVYDEHYAFGTVDVTDHPKWELVERMRAANFAATRDRLEASGAAEQ